LIGINSVDEILDYFGSGGEPGGAEGGLEYRRAVTHVGSIAFSYPDANSDGIVLAVGCLTTNS